MNENSNPASLVKEKEAKATILANAILSFDVVENRLAYLLSSIKGGKSSSDKENPPEPHLESLLNDYPNYVLEIKDNCIKIIDEIREILF